MMRLTRMSLSVMAMGAIAGVTSSGALASGYRFGSQSVSAQGYADANGAQAADASTIFYNPAGMSLLDGDNISGGLTLVVPNLKYTDSGSEHFTGSAVSGTKNTSSFAPTSVTVPSFYYTHQVDDKIHVGIGFYVPYAAKLNYGTNWVGRYGLESIDMESLDINPSISYKFNEHHSVGFGLTAEYMKATLQKAVDIPGYISSLSTAQATAIATQIALAGGNASLLSSAKDAQAKMSGSDWGYGFNFGYLYQLNDATRFGVAYRSSIHHNLDGNAQWDFSGVTSDAVTNALIKSLSGKVDSSATLALDTPETLSGNFYHDLNDKWSVMGDLTWTRNSRLQSVDIKFTGTSEGDLVIKQNWKDTYRLSLGAGYKYSDNLLLKAGVAYDQSPVASSSLTHSALPDGDRYWFSLGANYKLTKQSSIDFAYSYVMFSDVTIAYKDSCSPSSSTCTGNGEYTSGSYKSSMQFFGLQYNYKF